MRLLKQLIENISKGSKDTIKKVKDTVEDLRKKKIYLPEHVIDLVKKSGNKDEINAYRNLIYGLVTRIITDDYKKFDENEFFQNIKGYSELKKILQDTKDNQESILKSLDSKIVNDFLNQYKDSKLKKYEIHHDIKSYFQIASQIYAHIEYKNDMDRVYQNISNRYFSGYSKQYNASLLKDIFGDKTSYPKIKSSTGPYLILHLDDQDVFHVIDESNIIPYGLAGIVQGKIRENFEFLKRRLKVDENMLRTSTPGKTKRRSKSLYYYSDDKENVYGGFDIIFDISAGLFVIMMYTLMKGGKIIISAKEQKILYFMYLLVSLFNGVYIYQRNITKGRKEIFDIEFSSFLSLLKSEITKYHMTHYIESEFLNSNLTKDKLERYDKLSKTNLNLVFDINMGKFFLFTEDVAKSASKDLFLLLSYILGYTVYFMFSKSFAFYHDLTKAGTFFDYIHIIRFSFLGIPMEGFYNEIISVIEDFYENLN